MRKGPAALAAMLVITGGATAQAQQAQPAAPEAGEMVVVLALDAEADLAEAAASMTRALRAAAASVPSWRVHEDAEATLESTMQAHACRAPNVACMERVADALGASRIVFGRVSNEASGTIVMLTMHARGATTLGTPAREPLGSGRTDADYETAAEALWARLAGGAYQPAPAAIEAPEEVDEAPPPSEREPEDFGSFEMEAETSRLVSTVAPLPERGEADRTPWDDDRVPIGIGLAIAGGVFLATSLYAAVRLGDLNDDPDFSSFRARVPEGRDVCEELDQGTEWGASASEARRARSVCSEGKALEVLGVVFLGAGIAAAGVGAALLIGASASEDHVAVSASGRF